MDIMVVFQTMLKLFLLLVLGFVLFKCHIFDEYTNKKISALIVNVYTYAIMCLTKGDDSEFKLNFKQLLTPGIILIFVGIFIYLFDIQLPSVLMDTINSVGSLTAPLSMMMIGSSLAVYPIKDSFTDWRSYVFAFVRLMIVPFVTMIMCRLLHIDAYYANITIITNAMPVGSMVLMLATQYNANVKIVTRNIVVSTLLSVITIPIVVATMLL